MLKIHEGCLLSSMVDFWFLKDDLEKIAGGISHGCCAGVTSNLNAASTEIITASARLCDEKECSLHNQLLGTQAFFLQYAREALPQVYFESDKPAAKETS